jgi:hypothetical protein
MNPLLSLLLAGALAAMSPSIGRADPTDLASRFMHPDARIEVSAGGFTTTLLPRENSIVPTQPPGPPRFEGTILGGNAAPRVVHVEWWFVGRRETGDLYVFTTVEPDGQIKTASALYNGVEKVAFDEAGLKIRLFPPTSTR